MQQKIMKIEKSVRKDFHWKLISFGFVGVKLIGNNPKIRATKIAGKYRNGDK